MKKSYLLNSWNKRSWGKENTENIRNLELSKDCGFLSQTTVTESDIYIFLKASKPWSYFHFEMRFLDYKKRFIFFIEVDGSPFISLIFDSDYPGPQSRGLGEKEREE